MNPLVWNCEGLGTPSTVRDLAAKVIMSIPHILFVYEIRKTASWVERIRIRLGYKSCLSVDKIGKGGGLTLLWSEEVDLSISTYSTRHIDALVRDENGLVWHFTGVYGERIVSK